MESKVITEGTLGPNEYLNSGNIWRFEGCEMVKGSLRIIPQSFEGY